MRSGLMYAIPTWWFFAYGKVTIDGEHQNPNGVEITVNQFAHCIDQWLVQTKVPPLANTPTKAPHKPSTKIPTRIPSTNMPTITPA